MLHKVLIATAFALCALPAAAQDGSEYKTDPRSKCALWADSRAFAVRWEGNCKNGKADGPGRYRIEFADYPQHPITGEATFVDGKRNGRGFALHAGISRYEGSYRDDKMEGRGFITMLGQYEGERYDGEFRDGDLHGQGSYTWPDGRRLEGRWENGLPKSISSYRDQNGRVTNGVLKPGTSCFYVDRQLVELFIRGFGGVCSRTS